MKSIQLKIVFWKGWIKYSNPIILESNEVMAGKLSLPRKGSASLPPWILLGTMAKRNSLLLWETGSLKYGLNLSLIPNILSKLKMIFWKWFNISYHKPNIRVFLRTLRKFLSWSLISWKSTTVYSPRSMDSPENTSLWEILDGFVSLCVNVTKKDSKNGKKDTIGLWGFWQ